MIQTGKQPDKQPDTSCFIYRGWNYIRGAGEDFKDSLNKFR